MIYKKYEITKMRDPATKAGFLYLVHSKNKDDYFFDAKTLATCKKWIDQNPYPFKPTTVKVNKDAAPTKRSTKRRRARNSTSTSTSTRKKKK